MTPYERHHQTTIWARYATIFLGIWLFSTPLTFSIADTPILWSDLATGFLLTLFGFFSLNKKNTWAVWGVVLLGIWLQIAPLFFWASDPLSYLNDTFTGVLAITFALLIPGTPGESTSTNQPIPLGWSYNPSSWVQRMPIICLCLVCWFTARYMAAYQLGYLNEIWDPVFNNGTLKVITSAISNAFPISDAGLGAAAYTIETLMGCKGGSKRWYTMPWLVIMFGILVIPVGLISVILIMLQPIMIGYWCFWCLLTALCMLIMIALTVDEVMAVLQFLMQTTRDGRPFWKTFWKGGEDIHPDPQQTYPDPIRISDSFQNMIKGTTISWNLFFSIFIGMWFLFSENIENSSKTAAYMHILGALIVTTSILSMAEILRTGRFLNILLSLVILIGVLLFENLNPVALYTNVGLAILLIVLSIPRGTISETYGSLNRWIV